METWPEGEWDSLIFSDSKFQICVCVTAYVTNSSWRIHAQYNQGREQGQGCDPNTKNK